MQNEIYDEKNGLTYMLCGDYYLPELALTDIEPTYTFICNYITRHTVQSRSRKNWFCPGTTTFHCFVTMTG